jgi:hypothetical protein
VFPAVGLVSSGTVGGPFSPASKDYTLTNTGGQAINWTAAKTQAWVSLSSASGTLAAGASTTVTVSINSSANSLAAGSYSDTVSFTNTTNGSGNTTRAVSLTVNAPPGALSVTPSTNLVSSGTVGGPFSPASKDYTLTNTGGQPLNWTAAKTQAWIDLSSAGGALGAGASTTVTVSINSDANTLLEGSYSDTVTFTNTTNGTGNATRAVSLSVNDGSGDPPIWPGPSWNGTTTWAGRTPPTESGTLRGSGFAQKVICAFDEPPYMWVTGDKEITVGAEHGDPAWIQEVEFWLEGRTCTATQACKSPRTGAIGFVCTLDAANFAQDGDAELYATVRPVNGYERVIGPLPFTFNGHSTIARPVKTLKQSGGDYSSLTQALQSAPDGAIVKVDAGTYLEDSNGSSNNVNTRLITIEPADGLSLGDVIFSRTVRRMPAEYYSLRAVRVHFHNIQWDMSKVGYFYGYPSASSAYVWEHCNFIDPNGASGPPHAYYQLVMGRMVRDQDPIYHYMCECTVVNFTTSASNVP